METAAQTPVPVKSRSGFQLILQQAIYWLCRQEQFCGNLLQELTVYVSTSVPTAGITYNKKRMKFEVIVNPDYFEKLTLDQRVAVLKHEVYHFTNQHIFRFGNEGSEKEWPLMNIAADMAINQFIANLPEGCVKVDEWKNEKGQPLEKFKSFEFYFDQLKKTTKQPQQGQGDEGEGEKGDQKGKGQGLPNESCNWPQYSKYKPFDTHEWFDSLDKEEQDRMLSSARDLVKRTIDKTWNGYSEATDSVKDLLESIESRIKHLNYRGLLKYAIKRTVSAQNRTNTWYRPNKRYGVYAPGSTVAKEPALNFYMDTSGSISHTEANEFLMIVKGFLKASTKRCNIIFWHTSIYNRKKFTLTTELTADDICAGGTEPSCVLNDINETHPNLSIILTDGQYGARDIKVTDKVIWVISKGGDINHPYRHIGITVPMEHL